MQVGDVVLLVVDERVVVIGIDGGSIEYAIAVEVMEHGIVAIDEALTYDGVYIVEGLDLFCLCHTYVSQVKPQVIGLAGDGLLGLFGLSGLCGYFGRCGLDNDIHVSSGMVDHILTKKK